MVVLNDFLPINILSLKIHITNKLKEVLNEELDNFIEDVKKKRIMEKIIENIKDTLSSDYFLYLIMHDNYCTHKFKKGKKEGHYCAKKIKSNNSKKMYLCCKHDPGHIPVTKIKNNMEKNNDLHIINNINIFNDISDEKKEKEDNIDNNLYKFNNKINIQNKKINYDIGNNNKNTATHEFNNSLILNNVHKSDKFKHIKKCDWKRLDITHHTGFIFAR